jgi:hypothetical protein
MYGNRISISFDVKYPLSLAANLRIIPLNTNNKIVDLIKSKLEKLIKIIDTKRKLEKSIHFPGIIPAITNEQFIMTTMTIL